jgi:hypothetical protein
MIILEIIKWIFILISVALAYGFGYALYQSWHFHPKFKLEQEKAQKIFTLRDAMMKERWEVIQKKFSLGTPEAVRIAVIEADALVDTALKSMGIEGEHLADRLSNLDSEEITTINRVWRAHRMRNDLVHTSGFVLAPEDAKLAMDDYEAFLKEIEML